jgi:hypothetical protein
MTIPTEGTKLFKAITNNVPSNPVKAALAKVSPREKREVFLITGEDGGIGEGGGDGGIGEGGGDGEEDLKRLKLLHRIEIYPGYLLVTFY